MPIKYGNRTLIFSTTFYPTLLQHTIQVAVIGTRRRCAGMGNPSDLNNGDDHYWGVWWGKDPFKMYATHIARFMSEYGLSVVSRNEKQLKQYATPEDYDIFSGSNGNRTSGLQSGMGPLNITCFRITKNQRILNHSCM